jgi:predicted regulator of Ras-like GTPase activity (Roadblock/LC7/MglB family)
MHAAPRAAAAAAAAAAARAAEACLRMLNADHVEHSVLIEKKKKVKQRNGILY